jgi:DNA-binding response OmpR family regulator
MPKRSDTQKHIFAVNDDDAILTLFRELLEEEGYRVTVDAFRGHTQAVHDAVKAAMPDLVILDFIVGGEGSGWQLLQTLQMDRATTDIPIVICTAAVRQVTELAGHLDEMGIRVVLKPFDIGRLLDVIREVWDTPDTGG